MTDTTWAAKVLDGVGRIWAYSYEVNEADNGAEPEDWKTFQTWDVADPYPILGKEYVAVDDALAAIAKLAEGDGLVDRAGKYPEILMGYSQGDMDGVMALISRQALHEAADTITDLLAHIAALTAQNREMALDVLASSGQAQEAYAAQLAAEAERDYTHGTNEVLRAENQRIEAEAAALRAQVARIANAWPIVRDADCSGGTLASAMDEIEAAISDGAADEATEASAALAEFHAKGGKTLDEIARAIPAAISDGGKDA